MKSRAIDRRHGVASGRLPLCPAIPKFARCNSPSITCPSSKMLGFRMVHVFAMTFSGPSFNVIDPTSSRRLKPRALTYPLRLSLHRSRSNAACPERPRPAARQGGEYRNVIQGDGNLLATQPITFRESIATQEASMYVICRYRHTVVETVPVRTTPRRHSCEATVQYSCGAFPVRLFL